MPNELDGMDVFVAVAETRGFRAAGDRLDVSGSAVSQSLRKLEERLGVALVHRTTRSVSLTEAGERLYASARPALDDLRAAISAVGELGTEVRGTLRLHVAGTAETFLRGQVLASFLAEHTQVHLDLVVGNDAVDIAAEGFDGGIRLGEVIDRDMIAVPVSGDIRLAVVGAPSYFAQRKKPKHPRDLADHECINFHPMPQSPPYRWEFTDGGREIAVDVKARVLTNDPTLNMRLAAAGAGITIGNIDRTRDFIDRGELVEVLAEFSTPFPGYYLYYPHRRQASPALRALVEHLRRMRTTRRTKR